MTIHGKRENKVMTRHAKRVTNFMDIRIFNEQNKDWHGSFCVACSSLCPNLCARCHASSAIWHTCEKTYVRYGTRVLRISVTKITDNEMMYSKETDETSMLIYLGAKFSLPLFFSAELRID